MVLRWIGAVLIAVLGGAWLRRNCAADDRRSETDSVRTVTVARKIVSSLALFWSVVWIVLALIRLPYPFELEWVGGAMRDHCLRIAQGLPLYTPPGPDWIPYEYPPLYMWLAARLSLSTGCTLYVAMRAISILSTIGCALLIGVWTRQLIGNTEHRGLWSMTAAGLFLAAYRLTGAWYDVERIDMLFLFLSLSGILLLERGGNATGLAALILACAFFTKQQAILFVVGGAAAMAYRRQWRALVLFAVLSILFCTIPAVALNSASGGWFGYYCFHVPLANGTRIDLARQYLFGDLPLYAPCFALLAIAALIAYQQRAAHTRLERYAVLIAMTLMGLLGSLMSRAHWGGDQNVLIAGFLFLGTAACVAVGRMDHLYGKAVAPLCLLLIAQFLVGAYRPDAQLPTPANRVAGERYLRAVRDLERSGEVLCLDHGGQTNPPHFQTLGLRDVLEADKRLPESIIAALRAHRYAVVLVDVIPDRGSPFGAALAANYAPTDCLNMRATWVVTGFPTPGPDRPVWVLRPRRP